MMLTIFTVTLRDNIAIILLLLLLPLTFRLIHQFLTRTAFKQAQGCQEARTKAIVGDPILGVDFLYGVFFGKAPKRYLDTIFKSFQRLGATYTVERWTWTSIFTQDSENIKHMLTAGSQDFDLPGIRVSVLEKLFGQGIFSVTGHTWTGYRTVIRRGFKGDATAFINILERHFQNLVNSIPTDGSVVDLQPLFMGLTMDVATEKFMGHSTEVLSAAKNHSKEQQFVEDYNICSLEFGKQMQLGPLHRFRLNRRAKKAKKRMSEYVDALIQKTLEHQKDQSQNRSLLQDLVSSTQDRTALTAQVLHILLASRDTTASLLSNLFFMLAKHPQIYNRLRRDVLNIAGNDAPTSTQLRAMTYLKWCVNESLRLHPVIPSNAREALRDTTLPRGGGKDGMAPLFVPKGAIVIYTVYAMHRDENVFGADAEDFVPERWDGLRPGWAYLPFNGGNRACLGQQYALLEAYYIVARMVQKFKTLESRDDEDWMELYGLALCSKNGTKVALTG